MWHYLKKLLWKRALIKPIELLKYLRMFKIQRYLYIYILEMNYDINNRFLKYAYLLKILKCKISHFVHWFNKMLIITIYAYFLIYLILFCVCFFCCTQARSCKAACTNDVAGGLTWLWFSVSFRVSSCITGSLHWFPPPRSAGRPTFCFCRFRVDCLETILDGRLCRLPHNALGQKVFCSFE